MRTSRPAVVRHPSVSASQCLAAHRQSHRRAHRLCRTWPLSDVDHIEHLLPRLRDCTSGSKCRSRGSAPGQFRKEKGIVEQTWNKKPFQGNKKTLKPLKLQGFSLVRGTGLEPVTPCTSSGRVKGETTAFATKLHHAVF